MFPAAVNVIHILHICRQHKSIPFALQLHQYLHRCGIDAHRFVGNDLLSVFLEFERFIDALKVFGVFMENLDENTWISFFSSHWKQRMAHQHNSFSLFCRKLGDSYIHPNLNMISSLLKICTEHKDSRTGSELHAYICRNGLLTENTFLGNTLINLYCKCGLISKARKLFDELVFRDVYSWTSLIAGYTASGYAEEAFNCFKQMQLDGVSPNAVTYLSILKACGMLGAKEKGQEIHETIVRRGFLDGNTALGTALVDMYVKCGLLSKAQEVFEKLKTRNVVSWTVLITGYTKHGLPKQALCCYDKMQDDGVCPNTFTYTSCLKACAIGQMAAKGMEIHAEILRMDMLDEDHIIGNSLVDMYAKCGWLVNAKEVFDKLSVRDSFAWNSLISGFAKYQQSLGALNCFKQMQLEGICPDTSTFVSSLKACGSVGAIVTGKEIHARFTEGVSCKIDVCVGSLLVDLYAKCGLVSKAQEVFDKLPTRDISSWNSLILGHSRYGHNKEVLICFEHMQLEKVSPDAITYSCCLNACATVQALQLGIQIHEQIKRNGLLENDPVLGNALVDMYIKCSQLSQAQTVFDELPNRDVFSWTELIAGYGNHDLSEKALEYFDRMVLEGVIPDAFTLVCCLNACSNVGSIDKGREIHAELARNGLLVVDKMVGNALIDMYCKCSALGTAQDVFDTLPVRDAVTWTILITGYTENELFEDALNCYDIMQVEGVLPDDVTYVCILKSCAIIGAIEKGRQVQDQFKVEELRGNYLAVGNALVDMYAACGCLAEAQEIFDKLPARDVISWNTLIAGYGHLGEHDQVFHTFKRMREGREKPDSVTFVNLLSACSQGGLVEKGLIYFELMCNEYGIDPTIEHYTCILDLFCRAGHLDMARAMINKMCFLPDVVVWQTVLDACQKCGNVDLGRTAFEHTIGFDDLDAAAFVSMCRMLISS